MKQRGFTLVEMIVAMVLIGIVAGMVAVFIRAPMVGYRDAQQRGDLVDTAELALRRISREVRLALPNSVLVSANAQTLQFLLTTTGGVYQSESAGLSTGSPLVFNSSSCGATFTVLSDMPAGRQAITVGQTVVVYNLGFGTANAYTGGNAATITNVTGSDITIAPNPFCLQNPPLESPTSRFQVVAGTVWYVCNLNTGTLTRSYVSGVDASASPPANATNATIATNVTSCAFDVGAVATRQTAMLVANLGLRVPSSNDPAVTLTHQIHFNNTP